MRVFAVAEQLFLPDFRPLTAANRDDGARLARKWQKISFSQSMSVSVSVVNPDPIQRTATPGIQSELKLYSKG